MHEMEVPSVVSSSEESVGIDTEESYPCNALSMFMVMVRYAAKQNKKKTNHN